MCVGLEELSVQVENVRLLYRTNAWIFRRAVGCLWRRKLSEFVEYIWLNWSTKFKEDSLSGRAVIECTVAETRMSEGPKRMSEVWASDGSDCIKSRIWTYLNMSEMSGSDLSDFLEITDATPHHTTPHHYITLYYTDTVRHVQQLIEDKQSPILCYLIITVDAT